MAKKSLVALVKGTDIQENVTKVLDVYKRQVKNTIY